jgi:hypothetical protein
MKLNDGELNLYAKVAASFGKELIKTLNRAKEDLFDPETLTAENLESRKAAWAWLEKNFIWHMTPAEERKKIETNHTYE